MILSVSLLSYVTIYINIHLLLYIHYLLLYIYPINRLFNLITAYILITENKAGWGYFLRAESFYNVATAEAEYFQNDSIGSYTFSYTSRLS